MAEQIYPIKKIIKDSSQKYTFTIYDNIQKNYITGESMSHNFKIGGEYPDCVNVSVLYENGIPTLGKLVTAMYDPECTVKDTLLLERGGGSEIMIKTLMNYVHSQEPTIKIYYFEDDSRIECGIEEEQEQKKKRKRGTHAVPVDLFFFSIAFNGCTWYEKYFNACHTNSNIHKRYRERVEWFRNNPDAKPTFTNFISIGRINKENGIELEKYYNSSTTYKEFFESIPKNERCRLVRTWISTLVAHYMKDYFFQSDWMMDVIKMNKQSGGNGYQTRKRRTRKNMYYCPKGHIYLGREGGGMNVGVDEEEL